MRLPASSVGSLAASLLLALALAGCGDDGGTGGAGGAGGGAGGTGGGSETQGCDGATLLASPDDTAARGPWAVGAREAAIGGLVAEVWYPAASGSEAGAEAKRYDVRTWLPDTEAAKIPEAIAPFQTCDCYADLPIDDAHGPYPVIVFVHGTAGFRTQSLELVQHWASRGFVVVAADHPGLYMKDLLQAICDGGFPGPQDLGPDLAAIVAALQSPAGDLAFLDGRIDASRIGMSGHSAGGGAVSSQGDVARVLVPMAAGGAESGTALESLLVLGALEDKVVPYSNTKSGYESSPSPKRLVGVSPAGHLTFSSLCAITNADGQDIVTVAEAQGVCGVALAGALFDCDPSYLDEPRGWTITNDASTAAFEEVLQCKPERGAYLDAIAERYSEVKESLSAP